MSNDEYRAITESLKKDGREVLQDWKKNIDEIADSVPDSIPRNAFSYIPGSDKFYTAYVNGSSALKEFIQQGAQYMGDYSSTLLATAIKYIEADDLGKEDIEAVEKKFEKLWVI